MFNIFQHQKKESRDAAIILKNMSNNIQVNKDINKAEDSRGEYEKNQPL